ncbi:MAG: hypothetical protein LBT95_06990 [Treponema sp.]|nr:hypothetical protein [Treponema sp.]
MTFFVFLLVSFCLSGQEGPAGKREEPPVPLEKAGFFPVVPLMEAVYAGRLPWGPDWVPHFPPDGFSLPSSEASALTLTVDNETYSLVRNEQGFLKEFPLFLEGAVRGVQTELEPSGAIRGFRIGGEIPWDIEVLAYTESPFFPAPVPSRLRIFREGEFYFVFLSYAARTISETWFDAEGRGVTYFSADFIELPDQNRLKRLEGIGGDEAFLKDWDYDSGGNFVAIQGSGGVYSALYDWRGLPRYWKRRPAPEIFESLTLQWDERGFLVRMSGIPGAENTDPVDFRYEYSLDERGNWTERREIRMLGRFGLYFPSPGFTVKRIITYNADN